MIQAPVVLVQKYHFCLLIWVICWFISLILNLSIHEKATFESWYSVAVYRNAKGCWPNNQRFGAEALNTNRTVDNRLWLRMRNVGKQHMGFQPLPYPFHVWWLWFYALQNRNHSLFLRQLKTCIMLPKSSNQANISMSSRSCKLASSWMEPSCLLIILGLGSILMQEEYFGDVQLSWI